MDKTKTSAQNCKAITVINSNPSPSALDFQLPQKRYDSEVGKKSVDFRFLKSKSTVKTPLPGKKFFSFAHSILKSLLVETPIEESQNQISAADSSITKIKQIIFYVFLFFAGMELIDAIIRHFSFENKKELKITKTLIYAVRNGDFGAIGRTCLLVFPTVLALFAVSQLTSSFAFGVLAFMVALPLLAFSTVGDALEVPLWKTEQDKQADEEQKKDAISESKKRNAGLSTNKVQEIKIVSKGPVGVKRKIEGVHNKRALQSELNRKKKEAEQDAFYKLQKEENDNVIKAQSYDTGILNRLEQAESDLAQREYDINIAKIRKNNAKVSELVETLRKLGGKSLTAWTPFNKAIRTLEDILSIHQAIEIAGIRQHIIIGAKGTFLKPNTIPVSEELENKLSEARALNLGNNMLDAQNYFDMIGSHLGNICRTMLKGKKKIEIQNEWLESALEKDFDNVNKALIEAFTSEELERQRIAKDLMSVKLSTSSNFDPTDEKSFDLIKVVLGIETLSDMDYVKRISDLKKNLYKLP